MAKVSEMKKLSIKSIMGLSREDDTHKFMIEKAKNQTVLCAIAGDVTGYRQLATQFGKSFALVGTFVAQNLITGENFEASQLFLPKDAADNLVAQFDQRKELEGFINFACQVKVVEDKGQGFMYITTPIRDAKATTRRNELLSLFAALPAQIGSGKKAA